MSLNKQKFQENQKKNSRSIWQMKSTPQNHFIQKSIHNINKIFVKKKNVKIKFISSNQTRRMEKSNALNYQKLYAK